MKRQERLYVLITAFLPSACGDPEEGIATHSDEESTSRAEVPVTSDAAPATGSTDTTDSSSSTSTGELVTSTTEAPPLPVCGDGSLDPGEACDDGNADDHDACLASCALARCGDGVLHRGEEECDDGDLDDDDACTASCSLAFCGDGHVWAGFEACDDGNDDPLDTCTPACTPTICGDGIVQAAETCDSFGANTMSCDADCTAVVCGDGHRNALAGEECDDGNASFDDNCYPTCKAPSMLVFLSSATYHGGDIGGLSGGDAKCNALAQQAGRPGTFKAWLWTFDSSPVDTFDKSPGRYIRPDNQLLAHDFDELASGKLVAPINVTETGVLIKEGYAWSGAHPDSGLGNVNFPGNTCMGWTQPHEVGFVTGVKYPVLGYQDPFGIGGPGCNYLSLPIICVQQLWHDRDGDSG